MFLILHTNSETINLEEAIQERHKKIPLWRNYRSNRPCFAEKLGKKFRLNVVLTFLGSRMSVRFQCAAFINEDLIHD